MCISRNRQFCGMIVTLLMVLTGLSLQQCSADMQNSSAQATSLPKVVTPFDEQFSAEKLDLRRWTIFRVENFKDSVIGVVGTDDKDRRLRLHEDMVKTRPRMKVHGIRTTNPVIDLKNSNDVKFDVDMNNPVDCRKMSVGVYICPFITDDPANQISVIKIEYTGWEQDGDKSVYGNAYLRVEADVAQDDNEDVGNNEILFDDGFANAGDNGTPFVGRKIGVQHMRLLIDNQHFTVWENDKQVCSYDLRKIGERGKPLLWSPCYLYLAQTYDNDTPSSEVFFDNISIRQRQLPTKL